LLALFFVKRIKNYDVEKMLKIYILTYSILHFYSIFLMNRLPSSVFWLALLSIAFSSLFMQPVFAMINEAELEALLENTTLDTTTEFTVINESTTSNPSDTKPVSISAQVEVTDMWWMQWSAPTEDLDQVVNRMYQQGFTIHSSKEAFGWQKTITRQEMAKFIVMLWLQLNMQRWANPDCGFKDIYQADKTLIPYIITACNMWLMKWSNGSARPTDPMTKAEVITTVMRTIRNDITTNAEPRYKNYYNTAKAYGITADSMENMNNTATREAVARFLFRANKFKN